jgi:uncharacterized surface protein with fasciclin (FAS1) repeats
LGEWSESEATTDVVDTLLKDGGFTSFLKLIAEADLAQTLKGAGPYTVFAPSDAAFAKIKLKDMTKLLADKEKLRRTVLIHVLLGRISLADLRRLKNGDRLPTLLEGRKLKLTLKKDRVSLDRANVVKGDIDAQNGILHVLDAPLSP